MFFKIFLSTFYLFIIIFESSNSKSNTKYYKKQSISYPSKEININISCEECLKKNIFFPEYQNKYSRINELNDTNFNFIKVRSNRSVTLVPDNLIEGNEKQLEIDKITKLINKIEKNDKNNKNLEKLSKNQNEIYGDDYFFYSETKSLFNNNNFEHKYLKKNTLIYEKNSSSIKDIISTNPDKIIIEYEICKPKIVLFRIKNPHSEENLIIKNIKTDLYQVKIFPYLFNKKSQINNNSNIAENKTPSINSFVHHIITPKATFPFQLLILIDHKTSIKGTLYVEFNEKKVLLIPIHLIGKDNSYRIKPIYFLNYQVKKLFYVPVEIFNPTKNILYIQEIIHSFEKIKVYWPNGEIFNNNISSVTSSMLQIEPLSYKQFFFLKFYSTKQENEYGFIHIRTDKNVIVIPVLLNIVNEPIITYPKILNFGLCDVTPKSRNNFIRIIPLKILNDGIDYIKIGKVYINYDELFLQFHQNFGGENIVLKPNEEVIFGYVIFNSNLEQNLENILIKRKKFFGKIIRKSIYIETNSTDTPLKEIEYSYMTYINNELLEISGNIQTIPKKVDYFSFVTNIKFKNPVKLQIYNSHHPGENITIYNDKYINIYIMNPINEYQAHYSNITVEITKLQKFRNNRYYFLPLKLNNMLYTIIPLQLDNNDLTKIYCGDEEKSKTLSICLKNLIPDNKISTIRGSLNKKKIFYIDFGKVPLGVKKQKFLYLINENESPISINNILIDYDDPNFYMDVEGYEYLGREEEPSYIKYPKKGKILGKLMKSKNKEHVSFKIYPNTAVKISINVITNNSMNINANNEIDSSIIVNYGDKNKFILSLEATIYKGNMNLSPLVYKFEPSFQGLFQKIKIYSKSSFNFPLHILSVLSNDDRIIPQLLTDRILPRNKTAVMQVNFDPSKTFFNNDDQFEVNMSNCLTYKELYLWKANEKFFNKLGSLGRTEINANVTITTSIDKKDINFKSFLIKPNLSKKDHINFGLVRVGRPEAIYVEGINPSDKMLLIKLILANENFSEFNNNFMFNEKDRKLIELNNDFIIFGCNFIIIKNGTTSSKYEYIAVSEKIDPIEIRKGTFDKKKLVSIIYKYGNDKVKSYFYQAQNIFCKYDKKNQNEILFNQNRKNDYLISQIFSDEFNNEILSVKNMTKKPIKENNQYKFEEKKTFMSSILNYIFNFCLKYFMNISFYSNINIIEPSQSFFIPKNIQDKVYQVPPHKKFSIGPIVFKPNKVGEIKGTLFLKNNLTILYPLKLRGEGGAGNIKFLDYYMDMSMKKCRLYEKKNFIIEIDENIYEKEIKGINKFNRTISLMNDGNFPIYIKNMTIDNSNKCEFNNMRIIQCKDFSLNPLEILNIDIEITPNFRHEFTNKIINFNTDYQAFYLNVIILISNDFYETKNNLWIYFKCTIIVFSIIIIMLYSLGKIISLFQKQRREMCDNNLVKDDTDVKGEKKETIIKLENNDISSGTGNKENNKNNNYQQSKGKLKQGKKKKNRNKSSSSLSQKDEINIINNSNNAHERKEEQIDLNNINKDENEKEKVEDKNNKIKEEKSKNDLNEIINESNNNDNKEEKNINSPINIPKSSKKRKIKSSYKKNNRNSSDRIQVKRNKTSENEDVIKNNKDEEKNKTSIEQSQRKKSENEDKTDIIENNYNSYHYNNNKNYRNNIKKGKGSNKKYYPNNNKKYITYDGAQSNNSGYASQQPKKQVTKIKLKENNAKNLKELFEMEYPKTKGVGEEKKIEKEEKVNDITINDNNNLSNIKPVNDEGIEDDYIDEDIFDNKKTKEAFNYHLPINKKIGDKVEEMNPTFLNDIKTNNAFDAEQELLKSLKKENKDVSFKSKSELSKEDIDYDFSNSSSHFNFDYHFFERKDKDKELQQSNDAGEYSGNNEDFRFKSIIDNLNNIETPFIDKSESEDPKDEEESNSEYSFKENEYEKYFVNKNRFYNNLNYYDYQNNYDNFGNEDNGNQKNNDKI